MRRKGLLAPIIAILLVIPVTLLVKDLGFEQVQRHLRGQGRASPTPPGLVRNSNVKIGGVDAGLITEPRADRRRHGARSRWCSTRDAGEIGAGATAAARPVNLLGEKYVDLEVGDLKDPQPSGTLIPMERTSTPVEIDDALNILEPGVRARLRILINEAGIMLAGRGADFNGLLEELPPAIDELAGLVQEARSETERMGLLIEQGDRVLASIAGERDNLGKLVDSAANALEVTASRREELGQTFTRGTVRARGAHAHPQRARRHSRPARAHGAPTSPRPPTRCTTPSSSFRSSPNAAEAALKTASDVAPDLERLGREGHPIVAELKPTLERTNSFLGTADPILKKLAGNNEPGEGSFAGLMGLMHNWALAIPTSDGLSHLFGIKAYVSNNTIRHAVERMTSPGDVELSSKAEKKPASDKPKPSSDDNVNAYAGPDEAAGEGVLDEANDKVKQVVDKVGQTVKDTVDKVNDVKDKLLDNVKDKLGSALGKLKEPRQARRGQAPRAPRDPPLQGSEPGRPALRAWRPAG